MRSLTELEDILASDLAWRRTELQAVLGAVRANRGPAGESFRRGGIALLYAHWEGYTKNALLSYWKYVARKKLAYKDLALNFVALGIEREAIRQVGLSETERRLYRVRRMNECHDERALMVERDIDTQSNLNSDVLAELFLKLGLDYRVFPTKEHFLDYSLLRVRNSIAHGEYLEVSIDAYGETHREVLGLINSVRSAVLNAAALKRYRRTP